MQKPKFKTHGEDLHGDPIHYFASSLAEWKTGTDLVDLLARMQRGGFPFNVYRVNLPDSAGYQIRGYRPEVPEDQLDWIGFFERADA